MATGILVGRVAIVTGAGSGIGRAACRVLAREGASIVAADRNGTQAVETVTLLPPGQHLALPLDVSDAQSVSQTVMQACRHYSAPPSVAVNCAGITRDNFMLSLDEASFQEVIDVNLKGTFLVMQAIAKVLVNAKIGGSIVNIASIVGKTGNMGQSNYSASKAGVEALTKTAAKEFGKFGIRCNAVVPGFVHTPMTDAVPEKVREKFRASIALGRFGKPEEVAEVIAFLASDRSSYINGTSVEVTGG